MNTYSVTWMTVGSAVGGFISPQVIWIIGVTDSRGMGSSSNSSYAFICVFASDHCLGQRRKENIRIITFAYVLLQNCHSYGSRVLRPAITSSSLYDFPSSSRGTELCSSSASPLQRAGNLQSSASLSSWTQRAKSSEKLCATEYTPHGPTSNLGHKWHNYISF